MKVTDRKPVARNLSGPKLLFLTALLIAFCSASWAGVTGKIAGVVVDAGTGEPIVNANVVIIGTDFGAATSLDGDYFIINVPPGSYSVSASFMGYIGVTQQEVLVYADFTTTLDFELETTVIEGQEVVVKAERKVIRHDITATTKMTTGDEIYNMPVVDFVGALGTVAGAVGSGSNIHIRGGRRGEVLYLIDGMEVKDPMYNSRMMKVGSPAVAEMITMTGGFEAEYGNAQSAVINVVTREGTRDYHGRIKYICDDLSPKNDKLFETRETHIYHEYDRPGQPPLDTTVVTRWQPPSSYQDYDYFEASLGGPEPITYHLLPMIGVNIPGYITFFIAGDQTMRNTTSNGLHIGSDPCMKYDASSFLELDMRREHTFFNDNFQLTYHMHPKMKLKLAYRNSRTWANPFYYRLNRTFPDDYTQEEINNILQDWVGSVSGRDTEGESFIFGVDDDGDGRIDEEVINGKDDDMDGVVDEDVQWYRYNASNHTRLSTIDDEQMLLTWNHSIDRKTYYHVKLSRYKASRNWKAARKDPDEYGSYEEPYTDLPGPDGEKNGRYDLGEPFEDTDGDGIWDPGNPKNEYKNWRGFFYTGDGLGGDVGQLVPYHLEEESYVWAAKLQVTSQLHRNHKLRGGIDYNYFDLYGYFPTYPSINVEGWGLYSTEYHVFPSDGAIYLQDKMEYKDITLNLGGRLDFFIPGEKVREVLAEDSSAVDEEGNWLYTNYIPFEVPKEVKTYVSPRLGVSYAITENAYLHAHYGHFYQRPRWDYILSDVNTEILGGTPQVGTPDLEPEKTVTYEVGVSWNPFQDYLIDVTGYLKDIKNWINTQDGKIWFIKKYPQWESGVRNFSMYGNQDYAFSRGLEFTLSKEYGTNFSGRISYTLSWVNAKNAYSIGSQVIRNDYVEPPEALAAGWDRRHSIFGNFGLNYGPREPIFGIAGAPGDWTINLIIRAASGLPYTPTDASGTRIEGKEMSERTPWIYTTDVNLAKFFTFGMWRPSVWLEVRNLFDVENVEHPDDNYGRAGKPNAMDDLTGEPGWVNDTTSPNFIQNPVAGPNPEAWDNPIIIRVGLGLEF